MTDDERATPPPGEDLRRGSPEGVGTESSVDAGAADAEVATDAGAAAVDGAATGEGMVRVPEDVLLQHVQDETVLLDLRSGTYFGLDPIGTRMLDLAREHDDAEAVVARLHAEYDASPEVLRGDLERLLEELEEAGLVTRRAS